METLNSQSNVKDSAPIETKTPGFNALSSLITQINKSLEGQTNGDQSFLKLEPTTDDHAKVFTSLETDNPQVALVQTTEGRHDHLFDYLLSTYQRTTDFFNVQEVNNFLQRKGLFVQVKWSFSISVYLVTLNRKKDLSLVMSVRAITNREVNAILAGLRALPLVEKERERLRSEEKLAEMLDENKQRRYLALVEKERQEFEKNL